MQSLASLVREITESVGEQQYVGSGYVVFVDDRFDVHATSALSRLRQIRVCGAGR